MALTWIDAVCLVILSVSLVAGILRGFVAEALGLAAWVLALVAARKLAEPVAALMEGVISHHDARLMLAFGLVILAVILVAGIAIRLLHSFVHWAGMGFLNRLAGMVFGVARGMVILVIATVLLALTPLVQLEAWQQSEFRPTLTAVRDWAVNQIEAWEHEFPASSDPLQQLPLPSSSESGS